MRMSNNVHTYISHRVVRRSSLSKATSSCHCFHVESVAIQQRTSVTPSAIDYDTSNTQHVTVYWTILTVKYLLLSNYFNYLDWLLVFLNTHRRFFWIFSQSQQRRPAVLCVFLVQLLRRKCVDELWWRWAPPEPTPTVRRKRL